MAIVVSVGLVWSFAVHQTSLRLELAGKSPRISTSNIWMSLPIMGIAVPITFIALMPFQIAISLSVFALCSLAIAYWDITSFRVPRLYSASVALIGLLFCAYQYPDRLFVLGAGMVGAFVLLEVARKRFLDQRGIAGLGGGDSAVFAALMAWLGPFAGLWTLALGSLVAYGLSQKYKQKMPMASALVLAGWVMIPVRKVMGYDVLWDMGWTL